MCIRDSPLMERSDVTPNAAKNHEAMVANYRVPIGCTPNLRRIRNRLIDFVQRLQNIRTVGVIFLGLFEKEIDYLVFLRIKGLHLRTQVKPFGGESLGLRVYKMFCAGLKLNAVTPKAHMLCVARHKKGRRSRALGAARFTPRILRDRIQAALRGHVLRDICNGFLRNRNIIPGTVVVLDDAILPIALHKG